MLIILSVPDFPRNPRLIGFPQFGHRSACLLTCCLQSGHTVKAIIVILSHDFRRTASVNLVSPGVRAG